MASINAKAQLHQFTYPVWGHNDHQHWPFRAQFVWRGEGGVGRGGGEESLGCVCVGGGQRRENEGGGAKEESGGEGMMERGDSGGGGDYRRGEIVEEGE